MNHLLIISCSQRKIESSRVRPVLPAIDRYDGPAYRCLRKFRSEQGGKFPNTLRILILSAKYGLIFPETEIPDYDLKITPERAEVLKSSVQEGLGRCLPFYEIAYGGMDQVFLNLGKTYRQLLEGFDWRLLSVLEASGGIGLKTQQMKAWLARLSE